MSIASEIERINSNISSAYAEAYVLGANAPNSENSENLARTIESIVAVLYIAQTLTDAQKAQARSNIDAAEKSSGVYVGSGTPSNGEKVQIDPSAEGEFTIPDVLQTIGDSIVDTMSQKAITEALQNIELATGERGTGILKVTTAPSSYTTAIGDYTPKYRIVLSTVKTQSSVSEVLIGDIIQYSYYQYKIDYIDSSYAYISATRTSIRGATGAAGATPVKGTDYYTEADKTEMVNAVIAALPKYTGGVS